MEQCMINDHGSKVNCNDNNGEAMPCDIITPMPSELGSDARNLTCAKTMTCHATTPMPTGLGSDARNLTCGKAMTCHAITPMPTGLGSDARNLNFGEAMTCHAITPMPTGLGSDARNLNCGEAMTCLVITPMPTGLGSDAHNLTFGEGNEMVTGCCLFKIDDDENDLKLSDNDGKLRGLFDQVLKVFLRGRPIAALLGDGQGVDLLKLFCLVRDRGGYRTVTEDKLWGLISEELGYECSSCAALKLIYYRHLDDLDKWLSRITRERCLENGRNRCGGSLVSLSIELKKMLNNFSIDEKGFTNDDDDDDSRAGKVSECFDVSMKEALLLQDGKEGSEVRNVVVKGITNDNDDDGRADKLSECVVFSKETLGLQDDKEGSEVRNVVVKVADDEEVGLVSKKLDGKAMASANVKDSTFRKRKRDMVGGMLNWLIKVAKSPCHPSIGIIPGCSRWKETNYKDSRSIALLVRDARLQKRYIEPSGQQSHKKKHKMHPSMYEDLSDNRSAEGIRCSERLLTFENTPCQCSKSSSADNCIFHKPLSSLPENALNKLEDVNADLSDSKFAVIPSVDLPIKKHVLVGSKFQAEVPIWTGIISESDPKWLGTQIWKPDLQEENPCCEVELSRKERPDSCECLLRGSVECHRFHILENRFKLKRELGLAFFWWKFDSMGEEISFSWSPEEEKTFKQIVTMNRPSLGKSYFPGKTLKDLVRYYFNVYLINRRSYQNRVSPKDIDSDNDEVEYGSVGDAYGNKAVKIRGSEPPMICLLNEQVMDFD